MQEIPRNTGICYLRIFATICVVWLHTNSTLIDNPNLFKLTFEEQAFFSASYQMMYWAVPIFFMITGALFLNPKRETSYYIYITKYVKRMILALFIFGIPFASLKLVMLEHSLTPMLLLLSIKAVIENDSFGHLWYLFTLIGIYLVLPIFKAFVQKTSENDLKIFLLLLIAIDFFFPLVNELLEIRIAFELPFKYPVFYVLLGYYITYMSPEWSKKLKTNMVVIVCCIILIWILNFLKLTPDVWTSYNSPLTAILAISIYSVFTQHIYRTISISSTIWNLDRLCFGVYLVHPLFIQYVYRVMKITPSGFACYPIATIVCFICFIFCAFIASYMMNKIKVLKKYVL